LKTEIIGLTNERVARRQAVKEQPAKGLAPGQPASKSRKGADPAQVYAKIVERYAMFFDRPEARLRFLNNTLTKQRERQEQLQHSLRRFRFLEKTRFYDRVLEARFYSAILEELRALAPSLQANKRRIVENLQVPPSARALYFIHQTRHAFYALGLVATGLLLFGLYSMASWSARHVNALLEQKYQRIGIKQIFVNAPSLGGDNTAASAQFLHGYQPEKVWQVKRGDGYEQYSNGCRIQTKYETDNHPRNYYSIPRGSYTEGEVLRHDIVGIVYHTSESDIVPFIPDNTVSIQKRSQGTLDWIRKNRSYNYLIDRFGETYRVVRDDHAAHHAGNSIWADSKYTYVGLNESFIGICFESTVKADTLQETLTEAQVVAGRALTNVLRSKYNIDDANCTTHGLVSINPTKMLIAFHHDWVRNFPFEAMGLSDKYQVPPPSVSDYGFTYDEEILEKLGNTLWPGAVAADEEFKKRANAEAQRRKLRELYQAQLDKARRLREPDKATIVAGAPAPVGEAAASNH
jgi:hypothetical protein